MMGNCEDCPSPMMTSEDFAGEQEDSSEISYWTWTKDSNGYIIKAKITNNQTNVSELWADTVEELKQHIHRKRVQFAAIENIKNNLSDGQLLTHVDYSENYKAKHQNEIQSAYFGGKSFSLFTACTYYTENGELKKLPTTVVTESRDKSRSASMSCLKTVIEYAMEQTAVPINKVFVASDGCSSQSRSK